MDDREDPISQFFPDPENVNLYEVLSLRSDATPEAIKKAYRRLALTYHPDKHATASDEAKADASLKFQQLGYAYAVLSDEKRRKRYDLTGKTDEGADFGPGEDGWEAYFADLFESVTREKLDKMKVEYQGSAEEVDDIKKAYQDCKGDIGKIMTHIPHSTHDDEARFFKIISDLISKGELTSLKKWESTSKDEKARLVRKKQSDKEAKEAEELAKELGVWDEFYGSGKPTSKNSRGKGKGKQEDEEEDGEEDHGALQALILKRQKNRGNFFDNLAAKYAEPDRESRLKSRKGSKRGPPDTAEGEESPKKSKKIVEPPEIDDEEFEKLQQKLFADKPKRTATSVGSIGEKKTRASKKVR